MWKLQDLESAVIWSEKGRCSSKMKPRLRAEWVVLRGQFCLRLNKKITVKIMKTVYCEIFCVTVSIISYNEITIEHHHVFTLFFTIHTCIIIIISEHLVTPIYVALNTRPSATTAKHCSLCSIYSNQKKKIRLLDVTSCVADTACPRPHRHLLNGFKLTTLRRQLGHIICLVTLSFGLETGAHYCQ